jgi:hypothetical protein
MSTRVALCWSPEVTVTIAGTSGVYDSVRQTVSAAGA